MPGIKGAEMQRGFTIVEVLVASLILAIGILVVAQMVILSQSTNTVIREYMEGREILARGIEVLKTLPINDAWLTGTCDSLQLSDTTFAYRADTTNIVGQTIGETMFDVYWNVADDYPATGYKTIRMTIVRTSGLTRPRFLIDADYVRWQ